MGVASTLRLAVLYARAGSPVMTEHLLDEPIYFPTWPISPAQGRRIIKRQFTFCGQSKEMTGAICWHVPTVDVNWHREFFSYAWLQDVAAIQSDKIASSFAREFINGFTLIDKTDDVHPCAWELEVTGERLTHWLYYRHFVLKGGSHKFFSRYQRSLIKHVQFLYNEAVRTPDAIGPSALKGLIAAATILPGLSFILDEALAWLSTLLARDIAADGIHVSQHPNHHVAFCQTLIEIKDLLAFGRIAYDPLNDAIARMGTMLAFLCHGDGRLALMHQNTMDDAEIIAGVLEASGADTSDIPNHAPDSGYSSLRGGATCCIMRLHPERESNQPIYGLASFECSDAQDRIIVNCGTYIGANAAWQDALSQPSAFSTASLSDDTATIPDNQLVRQAVTKKSSRTVSSCCYKMNQYILHERAIECSHDGQYVKGKDKFLLDKSEQQTALPEITLRFHLHPDIRCRSHKEGGWVLRAPGGSEWRLTSNAQHNSATQESVYLGYAGKPQKTQQLTLKVASQESSHTVRWELQRTSS